MSASTVRLCLGLAGWSAMLLASLSVARIPGDWGHGICGTWGCGPPIQALVACHLAWLAALTPPLVFVRHWSRRAQCKMGLLLAALSISAVIALISYQRIVWWPEVSDWQRFFFWQRCGFCLVTAVDVPILQLLATGVLLIGLPPRPRYPGQSSLSDEKDAVPAAPAQFQVTGHSSWRGQ
jgi:hypothetical protein